MKLPIDKGRTVICRRRFGLRLLASAASVRAPIDATIAASPLIVAALLLSACQSSPEPASGPRLVGWRPIQTFSGHGDSQTESFNIETGQWRIRWATTNENPPGSGSFKVTVHSAVSGRPLMEVVDHKGNGHGIALVTEDPRLYHLVIESTAVDWTVSVEESAVSYQGSDLRFPGFAPMPSTYYSDPRPNPQFDLLSLSRGISGLLCTREAGQFALIPRHGYLGRPIF